MPIITSMRQLYLCVREWIPTAARQALPVRSGMMLSISLVRNYAQLRRGKGLPSTLLTVNRVGTNSWPIMHLAPVALPVCCLQVSLCSIQWNQVGCSNLQY